MKSVKGSAFPMQVALVIYTPGREDVPVTQRQRFNFMINTDKEYMAGFRYRATKYFSWSTRYDSDMNFGAGITINY